MFGFARNMLDKSFMSGLSDFLDATQEPGKFDTWAQCFLTGITLPNIVGATARSADNRIRETDSLLDAYKARIPFLSKTLPARLNVWGDDVTRPSTGFWRFVSPSVPSPVSADLVDRELADIGYTMSFPKDTVSGFTMSKEQYHGYRKATGQVTYQVLSRLVTSPAYQALSDGDKEKAITTVMSTVRDQVRALVAPDLTVAAALKKELVSQGMSSEDAQGVAEQMVEQMHQQDVAEKSPPLP